MTLKGKNIVVTGASSGIGRATALMLAEQGAKLVVAARRSERLNELAEEIEKNGGSCLVVRTDVSDRNSVQNLFKESKEKMGKIDGLFANAGIRPLSMMKNGRVDEWEKMIDVNLKGVLYGIESFLPHFRENKNGHLVITSSVAGRKVFPSGGVYCATKFGVNAIAQALRIELKPEENIRVSLIEPGLVHTELGESIQDPDVQDLFGESLSKIKGLEPDDIARSVCYVLSQPPHVNVDEVLIMPKDQNI